MSRILYGGTPADVTTDAQGRVIPNAKLTVWSDRTNGTQYTDLMSVGPNGLPGDSMEFVTSDSDGLVLFFGPIGVDTSLWLESAPDRPRLLVRSVQLTTEPGIVTANSLDPSFLKELTTNAVEVRNATGSAIPKGRLVGFVGVVGQTPSVAPFNTATMQPKVALGVTMDAIGNNANGMIATFGLVTGLDTSAFPLDVPLWASQTQPGQLTATEPTSGVKLAVAVVTRSGPGESGSLLVRVSPGFTVEDLSGVANPSTGQAIVKQADGSYAGVAHVDGRAETVRIGLRAGDGGMGTKAVAIGFRAQEVQSGNGAIAIGNEAQDRWSGNFSIAIGQKTQQVESGANSVAIGVSAQSQSSGANSVAIGNLAGGVFRYGSGFDSIAVGRIAGSRSVDLAGPGDLLSWTGVLLDGINYTIFAQPLASANLFIDGVLQPTSVTELTGTGAEVSVSTTTGFRVAVNREPLPTTGDIAIGAQAIADHNNGIAIGHSAHADTAGRVQIGAAVPVLQPGVTIQPPNALRVGIHNAVLTPDVPTIGQVLQFDGAEWKTVELAPAPGSLTTAMLADGAVTSRKRKHSQRSVTAATTVTVDDDIIGTGAGTFTITLPADSALDGRMVTIVNNSGSGTKTIAGFPAQVGTVTLPPIGRMTVTRSAGGWQILHAWYTDLFSAKLHVWDAVNSQWRQTPGADQIGYFTGANSGLTGGGDATTIRNLAVNFAQVATAAQGAKADTAAQAADLATVATSGNYDDLDNLPTLGSAAALEVGQAAGTVAAGDDVRFRAVGNLLLESQAYTSALTGLLARTSSSLSLVADVWPGGDSVVAARNNLGSQLATVGVYVAPSRTGATPTAGDIPIMPGLTYTFLGLARSDDHTSEVAASIFWFSADGSTQVGVAEFGESVAVSSDWAVQMVTAVAPAGAAFAALRLAGAPTAAGPIPGGASTLFAGLSFHAGAGGLWSPPGFPITGTGTRVDPGTGNMQLWNEVTAAWQTV